MTVEASWTIDSGLPGAPIVLCDDDASFREALADALVSLGYAVHPVDCAGSLFALLQSLLPACLVLDVEVPDRNGLAIQQELRRGGFAFPVIFLTARAEEHVRVRALDGGAHAFLTKPVQLTTLNDAIVRAVSNSPPPC